jgi:hypothetical protein
MIVDQQNIYWLFSSSAQAISAFVAFLLTGFALVLNMMDGLQVKDETLEEIHDKLKIQYYKIVRILVVVTAFAIVFSLLMVYLNGKDLCIKPFVFIITIALNFASIIGGIFFVITIIDPNKYKKAAQEIIQEEIAEKNVEHFEKAVVDQFVFIGDFIKLEKTIRDLLRKKNLFIAYGETPQMMFSFRNMIMALFQNELINNNLYQELSVINKFRNLVVHGHQANVEATMMKRLRDVQQSIDSIS